MTEKTIDLGTLHQQLGASATRRAAIKDRYDAILEEAQEQSHDLVGVHGDPQGMNQRVSRDVGGFLSQLQPLAQARVAGWNVELDQLAQLYAFALIEARALNVEITLREAGRA